MKSAVKIEVGRNSPYTASIHINRGHKAKHLFERGNKVLLTTNT